MRANDRIDYLERRLGTVEAELVRLRRLVEEADAKVPETSEPAVAVRAEAPLPPVASMPPAPPSPPVLPPVPSEPESTWDETPPSDRWYERSWEPGADLRASDLLGARALAWTGGIVTLFGIVLFFALAVNRGWIGEAARVVLGGCTSAIVFGGGLFLRRRFGDTHSAVAAVGAGIGGAYATLLAAGPYYDLIPDWAALVLAGSVAIVAGALSLLWSSELVAGIGVVGALAVPVPIAWGDGVTTTGTGFVAVMFAASAVVAVSKRWEVLLSASAIMVVPQVIALAAEHAGEAAVGPLLAAAGCSAILLAAGIGLHLRVGAELEPFQATMMMAAAVLAGLCAVLLFPTRSGEGYGLLVVAAVYGAVALPSYLRGRRDLGLFLFAVGFAAAAVGSADLLSGASLGLAWAAEAAVLAWLARRILDLRVQLASLVYLLLAVGHVVLIDTPVTRMLVENDHAAAGIASLLAASAACAVFALCCGDGWAARRPGGIYAAIDGLLQSMRTGQVELRFATGWLAGFGILYAACLGLLELPGSWAWHEVAVTALLALVPLAVLVVGLVLPSRAVQLAAALGLGTAVLKNVGYDLFHLDSPQRAWTMILVGAALLAAGFLFQRLTRSTAGLTRLVSVVVGATIVYAIAAPIDLLDGDWHGISRTGLALVVPAAAYAALCALAFPVARLRDFTTVLWAEALLVAIVAAAFLFDGTATAIAFVVLGLVLVGLNVRLSEDRFQAGAGVCLVLATLHAVILDAPPTQFFESNGHPASGAGAVAAAAVLALALARVATVPERLGGSAVPLYATAGVLALYAASLVVLGLFQLGGDRIETQFERGHTAVSAMWGLLALLLLYLGLTRRLSLRVAGFALFGIALAKIFLFDLATLSSVARALSFLAVGAVLLLGGFFYQRLSTDALRRREAAGR